MLSLMSVPHNPILQFYALEILKMLGVVRHTYKIIGNRCTAYQQVEIVMSRLNLRSARSASTNSSSLMPSSPQMP